MSLSDQVSRSRTERLSLQALEPPSLGPLCSPPSSTSASVSPSGPASPSAPLQTVRKVAHASTAQRR
ncbi:hypothetical protein CABS03_14000 [Colletotrichum abscissum]|uniref:Uncharacterized protein n=1 Tax=Colletotrichum abscissum TaxID=1671311 RepID=A0A9P9XEE5_9PEZI|nr:hypothetical protein CABS02_07366 [Colletotrichum abscissum]